MNTQCRNLIDNETGTATYCPEDNKLRLYVGRVPREEYLALKSAGYKSTPKQDCDFVATWSPAREDIALKYSGGYIEDEDQSPADRAADRADRFSMYRDKRESEAVTHADNYEDRPAIHGYQSAALAERKAAAHERLGNRALTQWRKAEYWQHRTEGVIAHALHVSSPGVRMGRIKELESELRKREKEYTQYKTRYEAWRVVLEEPDKNKAYKAAYLLANYGGIAYCYRHPRPETCSDYHKTNNTSMYSLMTDESDPITGHEAAELYFKHAIDPNDTNSYSARRMEHLRLRLEYENQMLEAQGGRAAFVEMVPGGFIGEKRIEKVNKSRETGRIVSVTILMPYDGRDDRKSGTMVSRVLKVERLPANVYRAPTEDELNEWKAERAAAKKKAKESAPAKPKLLNPTREDAERLQAVWNIANRKWRTDGECTVKEMTQAQYSALSKGAYARCETVEVTGGGYRVSTNYNAVAYFPRVAKFRMCYGAVIVITDKPQKPIPDFVFDDPRPAVEAEVMANSGLLEQAARHRWSSDMSPEESEIFTKARAVGLAQLSSSSQFGVTEKYRGMKGAE